MERQEFDKLNVFGLGERDYDLAEYFSEQSYFNMLAKTDNGTSFINVTFGFDCRTNWHIHASKSGGGQVLICTAGYGYYQLEGKPVQRLSPGDVVVIPANVKHWHGARPDSWFSHIEVEIPGEETENVWLEEPVPERRIINIKSKKENKEKMVKIIKDLDLKENLFIYDVYEDVDNNIYINITDYDDCDNNEYGFSFIDNYNFDQFIKDILDVDKENTTINVAYFGYAKEDSDNYFYENGEIVLRSTREMGINIEEIENK